MVMCYIITFLSKKHCRAYAGVLIQSCCWLMCDYIGLCRVTLRSIHGDKTDNAFGRMWPNFELMHDCNLIEWHICVKVFVIVIWRRWTEEDKNEPSISNRLVNIYAIILRVQFNYFCSGSSWEQLSLIS